MWLFVGMATQYNSSSYMYCPTIEGPRTRVGQPKMKYRKLHELHENEVKKVHPIIMSICPNILEIFNFEQLPKHILRVFPSLGGGGNSILWS